MIGRAVGRDQNRGFQILLSLIEQVNVKLKPVTRFAYNGQTIGNNRGIGRKEHGDSVSTQNGTLLPEAIKDLPSCGAIVGI